MPKTVKAKKRQQDRTGYVMVVMDHDDRSKLENLCEFRRQQTGENVSLASTVRWLIRENHKLCLTVS